MDDSGIKSEDESPPPRRRSLVLLLRSAELVLLRGGLLLGRLGRGGLRFGNGRTDCWDLDLEMGVEGGVEAVVVGEEAEVEGEVLVMFCG